MDLFATLRPYWERGMTDLSSETGRALAAEAVRNNPHLTQLQVKNWIGNYKKKMSGKVYKRTKPSAISLNPRKKTAHDMFREQFLRDSGGKMDGIGAQWHQVTTDMQLYQCYKDKADAANLVPTTLSEQEKKDKASKIRDHIQEKVAELKKLGYECFGLIVKPNSDRFSEFGTENGLDFFKKSNIYWEFLTHVNAQNQEKQPLHSNWEKLRQAVQNKLNSSFKDCGFHANRVPWKKVHDGTILVHGFPHGLTPNCASSFGIENLQKILSSDVHITFTEAVHHENGQNLVTDEPLHDQGYIQSAGEPESTTNVTEEEEQNASSFLVVAKIAREPENITNATEEAEQNVSPLDRLDVPQTTENPEIEDSTWPIDALLNKRVFKKKTQYLVKWTGFDTPTWEPSSNIPSAIRRNFNKAAHTTST